MLKCIIYECANFFFYYFLILNKPYRHRISIVLTVLMSSYYANICKIAKTKNRFFFFSIFFFALIFSTDSFVEFNLIFVFIKVDRNHIYFILFIFQIKIQSICYANDIRINWVVELPLEKEYGKKGRKKKKQNEWCIFRLVSVHLICFIVNIRCELFD